MLKLHKTFAGVRIPKSLRKSVNHLTTGETLRLAAAVIAPTVAAATVYAGRRSKARKGIPVERPTTSPATAATAG